jgi:hypothetical protein
MNITCTARFLAKAAFFLILVGAVAGGMLS